MACALDSNSELSLVLSAGAGNSSGKDLTSFGCNALSESYCILIVNVINVFCAEQADFLSSVVSVSIISDVFSFSFLSSIFS